MALSTTKRFNTRAFEQAGFWNENGEPRLNIEGTVSIADEELVANVNVDSSSASYGGTYIGKATAANSEDFNVAYTSAETVTLSNYPSGITAFHADDIELVRQIDTNGAVVESYTRDDATMSISGDVLTVSGASFAATDTFVILTNVASGGSASSGSSVGGGNNTYSNASGDFTATITASTSNITVTGLPFTLEDKHVAMGAIKVIDSSGVVTDADLSDISVSGGVITLANEPTFSSGDTVVVSLIGPDKAYDNAIDAGLTYELNPEYAHFTSVEHLINESDLGIDATYDGGGTQDLVMTDTGETYTAETVAEGYTIYNVTQATSGTITADTLHGLAGDGGAGNPTADDITHSALGANWVDTNVVSIPECKRFVIPAEGYNFMAIDVLLDSQDANNSCYVKIYATLDENADDTDDIYWKDISTDVFAAAQLSADGIGGAARAVTQGIYFIDTPTVVLKYMVKIVAECSNGTQNNEFDIRIKKSS